MNDNTFRILVTGSRSWTDNAAIREALTPYRNRDAVLVHGDSRGADRIAAAIWQSWGGRVEAHPADWDRWGKRAGPVRNQEMIQAGANVCLAFLQEASRGSEHALELAAAAGIPVREHRQAGREQPYTPPTPLQPRPAGSSWQVITAALERQVGPGKGYGSPESWTRYLCPVHEGDGGHHMPSLGVRFDPTQGKTIVRCFAACDDRDVLQRIGLRVRDLWDNLPQRDPHRPHRSASFSQQRTPVRELSPVDKAIRAANFDDLPKPDIGAPVGPPVDTDAYVYRWPDRRVEGAVIRRETRHQRGRAKEFTQRRWTGTEWVATGFAPIPWKLPELLQGITDGRPIFICEGEKDAQRAHQAGLIATCNAMGAGKWTPEHAKWLRGAARVIVVADRDRPGYRHAATVADTLYGHVQHVRVLQARDGKDLSDHLDAGHRIEDLDPVPYLDRPHQQPDHPPPNRAGRRPDNPGRPRPHRTRTR